MLTGRDRAAEFVEDLRRRIVCGEVEDVYVAEIAERPDQRLGLAGVPLQLGAGAHAEEHGAAAGDEPTNVVVVGEGAVGALPRLVPLG